MHPPRTRWLHLGMLSAGLLWGLRSPTERFFFLSAKCWQMLRCNAGPMGRITGGGDTFGGHLAASALRGPRPASRRKLLVGC